jgi:hypothetical protein
MISALIFILFVLFMVLKLPVAVAIGLANGQPLAVGREPQAVAHGLVGSETLLGL